MSSTVPLPRNQVEALCSRDVQFYLASRGWVADPGDSPPGALVWHRYDRPGAEVLLPSRRDLADYTLRMADVVQAIAAVEGRTLFEVLGDLSGPPSDVLRLRVSAPDATLGNLPLDEGLQLLRNGRDLLLSAACSAVRPQAFHPEKSLKLPNEFIRNCRLGQTERGSFVATIITPVPPALRQAGLPGDEAFEESTEPFARRVTTRLMGCLEIVDEANREARLDPILDGVNQGISANLCDALAAMRPEGEQSTLEIAMSWSRTRPRVPTRVPRAVTFAQPDFSIVEEAARRLRERAKPRRERFIGLVHALQSDVASLFDDVVGKVVIRSTVGDQPARLKVILGREDYKRACDAHRDDQRVAVTGLIHHDAKVRVYELTEPRDFEVLGDE